MITETIRQQIYQELDKTFPSAGQALSWKDKSKKRSLPEATLDLALRQQQVMIELEEQLIAQILYQVHTLFEFSADDASVRHAVQSALLDIYDLEESCSKRGRYDAHHYALALFRKCWHGESTAEDSLSMPAALHHLEQASFFTKFPQEIARWVKRFLMIEQYHRLDARETESRLDRYHFLRSNMTKSISPVIHHFEDLLIWLDFRLLEEPHSQEKDPGTLSRELSKHLEGMISPDILMGDPIQPMLYLLLRCHLYCLAETVEAAESHQLERLSATRQLDSLMDLMRVVIHTTTEKHRLPEVATILDLLQAEGYNIEHQRFRDPYEAQLVPLSDTERLESTRLPLFISLDGLSGDFADDLAMSGQLLGEWHQGIVHDIIDDCESYASASVQPLPQAHLVFRLVRFTTTWNLARYTWPLQVRNEEFIEEVRKLLPDNAAKHLVRPRKGYEIKSRQELNQLIAAESRRQREALERVAATRSIQGYHDYAHFSRYVSFRHLRETFGEVPGAALKDAGMSLREKVRIEWVQDIAKKWSIEARQAHPHTLESVLKYLRDTAPPDRITSELAENFETSSVELQRVYRGILDQIAPVFYQLVVAYGRNRAQKSRASATLGHIRQMVVLFAPPLATLQKISCHRLKQEFIAGGRALYRSQQHSYLLNGSEWEAYLAWHALTYIENQVQGSKPDINRFLEVGELDGLLSHLERSASEVDLPPNGLFAETVLNTLLKLIKPPEGNGAVPNAKIQEIAGLLPQLDCAACGHSSCRDFARSLLLGQKEPRQCVQLSQERFPLLLEKIKLLKEDARPAPPALMDLLQHQHLWRASPEKSNFQQVLSVKTQKTRRLFLERLEAVWNKLSPKPQIFKCPDFETFYKHLCQFMGYEATERLRDEERHFLTEHGELRQAAEWRILKAHQDWLTSANRSRQSRPLLNSQDAAWLARQSYGSLFFLHQLGREDRQLVLRYRMERHQDGFSHWWNEDLLSMNHPDFFIRDWEDFSKIIKNAYWHQESSLSVDDALSTLEREMLWEKSFVPMLDSILHHWIDLEDRKLASERKQLQLFREAPGRREIKDISELRTVIGCLVDEMKLCDHPHLSGADSLMAVQIPLEDRLTIEIQEVWKRFQGEGFLFSHAFACLWDDLLSGEKDALTNHGPAQGRIPPGPDGRSDSVPTEGSVLADWGETIGKREALVRAIMWNCIRTRHGEIAEWACIRKAKGDAALPLGALKTLIRRLLTDGQNHEQVDAEIKKTLKSNRDGQKRFLRDVLSRVVLELQYERVCRSNNPFMPPSPMPEHCSAFLEAFPEVKSALIIILDRHKTLDRERLLHYLFLLAKMEGNLDTLTALLREIRETSDIIEAAWLRFTQDRIVEGPGPKSMPGASLGIPLLASRLKEKEPLNRGLREGVSRKEKKGVATAVAEILSIIRFHVLVSSRQSNHGAVQEILDAIRNTGYDLSGIEEEALERATQKELERRGQLESQKIWICTTVMARRLAAQHAELQEAERDFYKVRLDALKEEDGGDVLHRDIASRRGVALGQIKEEMYRQLSDLLELERIATFQNRIRQIVAQLDQKRELIQKGWLDGEISSHTVFYLLRQHQKDDREPSWSDFERFLRDHWFIPLAELRSSQRPDRNERIQDLDDRLRAILGVSLLEIESEASTEAEQDFRAWMRSHLESLETCT